MSFCITFDYYIYSSRQGGEIPALRICVQTELCKKRTPLGLQNNHKTAIAGFIELTHDNSYLLQYRCLYIFIALKIIQ